MGGGGLPANTDRARISYRNPDDDFAFLQSSQLAYIIINNSFKALSIN